MASNEVQQTGSQSHHASWIGTDTRLGARSTGVAGVAAVIAFSLLTVGTPSANAAPRVDVTQVCKEQYKQPTAEAKRLEGHDDPYSFYCQLPQRTASVGIPSGITAQISWIPLGDLDVQAYCNKHYGGAPAKGWGSTDPYWTCGGDSSGGGGW